MTAGIGRHPLITDFTGVGIEGNPHGAAALGVSRTGHFSVPREGGLRISHRLTRRHRRHGQQRQGHDERGAHTSWCASPLLGRRLPRHRLRLEILGRIPPHKLQRLVHLVISRHDAHEGAPAVDDHGILLSLVRRDPERD